MSLKRPTKNQLLRIINNRETLEDVAKHYKIGAKTLWRWRKYHGLLKGTVGVNHPGAKLNEEDVKLIHQLIAEGLHQDVIGKKFEVSQSVISEVHTYTSYRNVI